MRGAIMRRAISTKGALVHRGRAAVWIENEVPLKRVGRPEDVAALIAFLAPDEASYIMRAAVTVDRGATL